MGLNNFKGAASLLLGGLALVGLSSCGSSSSSGGTADLVLSGSLSATSLVTNSVSPKKSKGFAGYNPAEVTYSELQMSCLTLTDPPVAETVDVADDGTFALTLASSSGKTMGCYVLDTDGNPVATLTVEDADSKDYSGNPKTSTNVALDGNVDMGAVTLDLAAGTASVPKSAIASKLKVASASELAAAAWDASGNWVISAYPNLADGYLGTCPAGSHGGKNRSIKSDDCMGPEEGEHIFIKQVDGTRTSDSSVAHGMMIWASEDTYTACGSRLGANFADIQTQCGVDFSGNAQGVAEGAYTLSNAVSCDGGSVSNYWKCSLARTAWQTQIGCGPVDLDGGSVKGWSCVDGAAKRQIGLDGGCKNTATGAPVNISDWQNVSWNDSPVCDNSTESHTYEGVSKTFHSNTCSHIMYNGTTDLTCHNVYYQDDGFNWNTITKINANTLCSDAAFNSVPMERLRCYSNYYWQHRNSQGGATCARRFDFNWVAAETGNEGTDEAAFVNQSDEIEGRHAADLYDLGADGVGVLHHEQERRRGVPAGGANGTQWTDCRIRESFTLTFTPLDAAHTTAQVIMAQEQGLIDMQKDACVAYFANQSGVEKRTVGSTSFYVLKQKMMFQLNRE